MNAGITRPRTYVVMGVCGAGKSHIGALLAGHIGAVFDDSDDYHLPANRAKLAAGIPLTDEDRRPWYERLRARIVEVRSQGRAHVVACSALRVSLRDWLRAEDPPDALQFILLQSPRELIEARMRNRPDHFMPPSLIGSQLATLEVTDDLLCVKNEGAPELVLEALLARIEAPGLRQFRSPHSLSL